MKKRVLPLLVILTLSACTASKKATTTADELIPNLKAHITYLASDQLEGRRTGTKGEELAMEYIADQFKKVGLSPKGTEYYVQKFLVNDGKMMNEVNTFSINGTTLTNKDYFVYPYSPDALVNASSSIALKEVNTPWFYDLEDALEANKSNPHYDVNDFIKKTSADAKKNGATAIILYNSSLLPDNQVFDPKDRTAVAEIPVIYVKYDAAKKYFSDESATLKISLRTSIGEKTRIGHNVIGYIDNGAPTTVVLGAHYDHLGYGEDGNSMIRTGERNIHNGADDNASGTAALIEMGRRLKENGPKGNNYLFIAFSGEELGLFGSKYFVENPTVDIKSVSYMINMDMVGRLSDSSKSVTIGGVGTSPAWTSTIIDQWLMIPHPGIRMEAKSLKVRIDSSGTGPSDHTSFYRKEIPVLFYFTGLHTDYHKPSDDEPKINYEGIRMIMGHMTNVIALRGGDKLVFTKTREAQTTTSARFSVSLGVMPDYTYSGTGMRIDGVSAGKAAEKAGLQSGDIILKIGDYDVNSMENYMQALGKFKKGDKTTVTYKRGEETVTVPVEF
jgi:aminopeptidase YwaD